MKDRDNFLVAFDKLIKAALTLTVAAPSKVTFCALELEKAVEVAQDAIIGWDGKNDYFFQVPQITDIQTWQVMKDEIETLKIQLRQEKEYVKEWKEAYVAANKKTAEYFEEVKRLERMIQSLD